MDNVIIALNSIKETRTSLYTAYVEAVKTNHNHLSILLRDLLVETLKIQDRLVEIQSLS